VLFEPSFHGLFFTKLDIGNFAIAPTVRARAWESYSRNLDRITCQAFLTLQLCAKIRTPSFASPKKFRSSVSSVGPGRRTKSVQGCRRGLRLVGVRVPVLSVRGLRGPPSDPGADEPAVSSSGLGGVAVAEASSFFSPLLPSGTASRDASLSVRSRSRSLRSFFLALNFSAFSLPRSPLSFSTEPGVDAVAESLPFSLATGGVSLPDLGSEVDGAACGDDSASISCSVTLSGAGAGVGTLLGVLDVAVWGGNGGLMDVGVG
jgi:hypothetical protein